MRHVFLAVCALHFASSAFAQQRTPKDHLGLKPITEMTEADKYKEEDGGLYGGGKNDPPEAHAAAAKAAIAKIAPVDAKVVLLSIGMSHTTQEFSVFKEMADKVVEKSSSLVIVDGAMPGQAAQEWSTMDSKTWTELDLRLKLAGVTAEQVQVLWIQQGEKMPNLYGAYPKHALKLQADMTSILNITAEKFPNLRIAYLSSPIYAGWGTTDLNPEPYSYETGFALRSLILAQVAKKDPALNYDKSTGAVKCPVLLWGPYLWADGIIPRKADKLVWEKNDFIDKDGTHPSESGRKKVAEILLKFFTTDEGAKTWFLKQQK